MRHLATMSAAAAIIGMIACGSPPALIAEADLVAPDRLERALKPVPGWTMGAVTSNKVTGEFPMTRAETTYASGGTILKVDVTDSGLFARGIANLTSGYDEEKGGSHARSTTIGRTPAVENWNPGDRKGSVDLLVANRFVVTITGDDIGDIGMVRDFAAKFDTSPLAALSK